MAYTAKIIYRRALAAQVLYFTPQMRAYLLGLVPEAGLEFSLLDELSLLFRMLARESGLACQAANLLHALRQSREALGLGLLEGHAQKGAHAGDLEVVAIINSCRSDTILPLLLMLYATVVLLCISHTVHREPVECNRWQSTFIKMFL